MADNEPKCDVKYSLAVQTDYDFYRKSELDLLLNKTKNDLLTEIPQVLEPDHLNQSFSSKLLVSIAERGLKDADVYKKAGIDRKLYSKIISNRDYHPSKDTVFAFALALELDLEHTNDLLSRAGYLISHSDRRDVAIETIIKNQIYDIDFVNQLLDAMGLKALGD